MSATGGVYDCLEWLAGVITANTTVQAKCAEYWGQHLQAFVGVDEKCLPEEAKTPMLLLVSAGRQLSDGAQMRGIPARVCVATTGSDQPTKTGLVTSYAGSNRLDEVTWMIIEAILKASHTQRKYSVTPTAGPDDRIEPPVFRSWIGLDIVQPSEIEFV